MQSHVSRHTTHHRLLALLGAMALALALVAAGPASAQETHGYGGEAYTELVGLQALSVPGTGDAVDVGLAPALAQADADGLDNGDHSYARAANVDASLLFGELGLEGLLVEAEQSAPPTAAERVVEELVGIPADPLLNASVARAEARARWFENACVTGRPMADAQSHLADAEVLTGIPDGEALVALNNDAGQTVYSHSRVGLVPVDGQEGYGVRSQATTQLTAVRLFKGTANELTVNVLAPPTVTAVATGTSGGASVEYTAPVLQIVGPDGEPLGTLDAAEGNIELEIPGLAILRLGTLQDVDVADDGTHASATATLLGITLLHDPVPFTLADLTIAAGTVSAFTAPGGVDCPPVDDPDGPLRDVSKEASTTTVSPGQTFTYTITVPNRGDCTLTDVTVVDEIEGPDGTTISATDPPADSIEGLTATWEDIGPIDPGESRTLTIDVAVPEDAPAGAVYRETVTVTAMCDGQPVLGGTVYEGPQVPRRVAGPERVETSIEVSREAFERADTAVLARSDEFPDALSAATLAAEVSGPILVNPPATLRQDVAEELTRLGVQTVYLVGGHAALSPAVEAELRARGMDTIRLQGPARYETSARVADEVVNLGGPVQQVILARDDVFADALSAGNLATYGRAPILITQRHTLHPAAQEVMSDDARVSGVRAFIAGGTAAIASSTETEARQLGFATRRLAGAVRYGTAVAFADETRRLYPDSSLDPTFYASGEVFTDALVAAPAAHNLGGLLMLVAQRTLDHSVETRDWTRANRGEIANVIIVGGEAAISQQVVQQLTEQLNGG